MNVSKRVAPLCAIIFASAALLVACGGGGSGGGGATPPTGGSTSTPGGGSTSTPGGGSTATPGTTATPAIAGSMMLNGGALSNATVAFSCGCSAQAGKTTTSSSGSYAIGASAAAVPSVPNPTYTTVPGRNYMIIGFSSSGAQAWTMEYLGDTPAMDLNLSSSPSSPSGNVPDIASAGASMYVYYESQNDSDQSFDLWNFNTIAGWAAKLRAGSSLSAHETTYLSDISNAQANNQSMYPTVPAWNPQGGATANATILNDIKAIDTDGVKLDPALPTPCPGAGQCTGTPTP